MNYNGYNQGNWRHNHHNWNNNNPAGRIIFGLMLALVGVYFLLRALGILDICFHSLWPLILIAVGTMIGAKNNFRNNAWWILIVIGIAHLVPSFEIMGTSSNRLVWPLIIIAVGVMMVVRPKRRKHFAQETVGGATISSEDKLFMDVTFGGRKELVTSKDFKGGLVSVSFGGAELNLTQADFNTPTITIDCHVSFSALELIVPANWDLQNEIRPTLGSVEDQRMMRATVAGEVSKKLILTGSCLCSSIEIKSY
jgi:hypothetical protein